MHAVLVRRQCALLHGLIAGDVRTQLEQFVLLLAALLSDFDLQRTAFFELFEDKRIFLGPIPQLCKRQLGPTGFSA